MVEHQKEPYAYGYNAITELEGKHGDMRMDVGIIRVKDGFSYENHEAKERAILLIEGEVTFEWDGYRETMKRVSCFDDNPVCLHVPRDTKVVITGKDESELCYEAVENDNMFEAKLYGQEDTVSEVFGKDVLGNTSNRTVRTIIDDDIAPYSNLVIGEVINHPGKSSSYPPHYHVQPEVYHYRFLPDTGYGFSLIGDDAYKVEHRSTSCIRSNVVHPQCSAPGYAMYYVWMIPHIEEKRWLKDRTFEEKHVWLLDEDVEVWGEK
ncbi:5-deoxy-glucuronate isomerase [Vallitalea pronyensis]|uniref:5-deoxy-glucuronate isomerase n=1 Tax=Vallitalea pronyensis TaxID=1348613 RepID=A0A8J8MM26_9FIRM|nr:5-deoxy-glucuronate isomerase [Vallitalea pronyensis]QUI24024.1 5-deoxy-glucuronate isomerase [Vallitalea pronyensis]